MSQRDSLKPIIDDRVEAFRKQVTNSVHLDDSTRAKMLEHLEQLEEKLSNKPVSLADLGRAGAYNLEQFDDQTRAELEAESEDPIEFNEDAIRQWKLLCWYARFDMSEDEMLLLTEKTMKQFISAYGHPAPLVALAYWKFLVKRWTAIKKAKQLSTGTACKAAPSEKPTERHAGAVVSSGKMTSNRTEALPDGIEALNYSPEVASPTAAMWKTAPRTPDGSTRKGSSVATRSVASRSVAARSTAGANQSPAPTKPGWSR